MPCDAVAFAELFALEEELQKSADRQATKDLAFRIRQMLYDNNIGFACDGLYNDEAESFTFELDTQPAMNLQVGPGVQLKAMTVEGDFEVGKELIEGFIVKLQEAEESIRLKGEIETHVHDGDGNAPWQAYAEQTGDE